LTDWQTVSEIGDKAISDEIHKLKIPFEGPTFKMEEFQIFCVGLIQLS